MLYYLFRFLEQFGVPGSGMWSYISFRSLLALFQLEGRLLHLEQIETLADRPIQWEQVNRILEKERQKAFLFIRQALA